MSMSSFSRGGGTITVYELKATNGHRVTYLVWDKPVVIYVIIWGYKRGKQISLEDTSSKFESLVRLPQISSLGARIKERSEQ